MLFLAVIILGTTAFLKLPVELTPEVEYPRLTVTATWQGVSPEAVEAYLTSPMESVLSTIQGIKKIISSSSQGSCSIDIELQPDVNMDFTKVEINEKLSSLKEELPEGVSPPRISPYIPKDFRELQGFLTYTLSANVSSNEIRKYANDFLKTPLLSVPGVSNINVNGGNEREIIVTIDYDKAKYFGITNQEILQALSNSEIYKSAGEVNKNKGRIVISISNKINYATEILDQPVKVLTDGKIIRLGEIGNISDAFAENTNYYRINGKEAVFIQIDKEAGSNIVETANRVYEKIKEISLNFPPDFQIKKEIDKTEYIRKDINKLYTNAAYSLVIIILILVLIFRRVDYSLIIITSIIFSLLSSLILFYIFNVPLNILTIASITLGFGMMVDNSIVVVDYLDKHYDGGGLKRFSVCVKSIFFPVFASTLTTIAVFIPLLFLTGELKLYFIEFALAIVFSLSCSLIVAFTIIPLLFVKYSSRVNRNHEDKVSVFDKIYIFAAKKIFKFKKLGFVFLLLLIGLPIWLLPGSIETPVISTPYNFVISSDFYQSIKKYVNLYLGGTINLFFNEVQKGEPLNFGEETYLIVSLRLPNGNKLDRINELTKNFEDQILLYKERFKNVTGNVINSEAAYIKVDFTKVQSESAFPYVLKNFLTAYAVKLGGLDVSVYGFGPGFYSGGYPISSFSVTAKGFNYIQVKKIAEEFKKRILENPRIDNVDIDKSSPYSANDDRYEIIATVNKYNIIKHKISTEEIFDDIAKNTEGNLQYNVLKVNNEEVNYSVKFSNYRQLQLDELEDLIVKDGSGGYAKIGDVVNFKKEKVLARILRENRQYIRYITFDYKGPFQYGKEFINATIDRMPVPAGYVLSKNDMMFRFGEEDELQIWKILLMAFVLIVMITASLFESYRKPMLIILAIPFSFIGTIFTFYLFDLNLDRGAYAGILLLVGLSVNNSIILVDYISKNIKTFSLDELLKLSANRLRPIFTTSLTTVCALIPLMLSEESSFWKSLSYSIAGGIMVSAILTMIYIPLFYYLVNKKKFKTF